MFWSRMANIRRLVMFIHKISVARSSELKWGDKIIPVLAANAVYSAVFIFRHKTNTRAH